MEAPINERILSLVTALSERVKNLEAKLDNTEPAKRVFFDGQEAEASTHRPLKQQRTSHMEAIPSGQSEQAVHAEPDNSSIQNSSDAEAEDAATVLEFLAWGRLKDSNLTTGVREPAAIHEPSTYPERDALQSAQTWGQSPTSMSTNQTMEPLQISQIQEMLPRKTQIFMLFEYHSEWLLFMHCSFHVQTFRRELELFYQQDEGIINMTAVGLQWTSLLFAILCGSMACANPSQVAHWGFHQGMSSFLAIIGSETQISR